MTSQITTIKEVTTTERLALTGVPTNTVVFDTSFDAFFLWNGSAWIEVSGHFNIVSISGTTAALSGITYFCDTTTAPFTVTLPTPAINAFVIIKDSTGNFGTNNLTVAPHSTEKIDGLAAPDVLVAPWVAKTYLSNGTDWFSI